MNVIVAVDNQWGIGKDGDLLRPISADLKRFREMTTGNVLVIGRKTLESFPNQKPLPNRAHIVLTQNPAYVAEGVTLCHDIQQLPALLAEHAEKEVFVAGGGMIYEALLAQCNRAYVTKIDAAYPADTTFPNLDAHADWHILEQSDWQEDAEGVRFCFITYEKQQGL